jgi:hypothetical protein
MRQPEKWITFYFTVSPNFDCLLLLAANVPLLSWCINKKSKIFDLSNMSRFFLKSHSTFDSTSTGTPSTEYSEYGVCSCVKGRVEEFGDVQVPEYSEYIIESQYSHRAIRSLAFIASLQSLFLMSILVFTVCVCRLGRGRSQNLPFIYPRMV